MRTATNDDGDIEVLRTLAGAIWREYYAAILGAGQIEYMLEMMYGADVIRREMAAGTTWQIVTGDGEGDGEPIGYLSFTCDGGTGTLHLHKLYLVPRLHGRGIGAWLLGHVRREAIRAGARTIRLQVNKRNGRAIRAYERAGFRVSGAVVAEIGGGFVMDDYVMTLDVQT